MAVYDHTYKQFSGELTPRWSRFLVLPRHSYRGIFQSKFFIAYFVMCLIYPLVASVLVYLKHNTEAMDIMQLTVGKLVLINEEFFQFFMLYQGGCAFFLTLLIGPQLVSRDMTNNALPLYLSRPFSRAEYVVGKMSVLLILLSLITWIPILMVYLFQSYLEGWTWFTQNLHVAGAIFIGSWVWILLLALLSLAISSWVKWRIAASAALIGVFFIPAAFGNAINEIFTTRLGNLISLPNIIKSIWGGLFRLEQIPARIRGFSNGRRVYMDLYEPPLWGSWVVLAAICAFCLLLLVRKIRAYEVVS